MNSKKAAAKLTPDPYMEGIMARVDPTTLNLRKIRDNIEEAQALALKAKAKLYAEVKDLEKKTEPLRTDLAQKEAAHKQQKKAYEEERRNRFKAILEANPDLLDILVPNHFQRWTSGSCSDTNLDPECCDRCRILDKDWEWDDGEFSFTVTFEAK